MNLLDKTVSQLQEEGYSVILWTPEELRGANPSKVEDRLIELGWEVIDVLSYEGQEQRGEND